LARMRGKRSGSCASGSARSGVVAADRAIGEQGCDEAGDDREHRELASGEGQCEPGRGANSALARESTMKAIVQTRYGSPDVLQLRDIDEPVVGDDQVLVRVHAAAVNIGDWHLLRGVPYVIRLVAGLRGPRREIPGLDIAGQVEAVGRNVRQFRPCDEVVGWAKARLPSTRVLRRANSCPSRRTSHRSNRRRSETPRSPP
jgi:hypothetical protein